LATSTSSRPKCSWARAIAASQSASCVTSNTWPIASPPVGVAEMSLEAWRRVMAVNLDGVFLGVKHAVRAMRASGAGGSIVIVSSASGIKAAPGASAYAASKAALRLFAKSVALEVAQETHPGEHGAPGRG